jgi:hypothetical protein
MVSVTPRKGLGILVLRQPAKLRSNRSVVLPPFAADFSRALLTDCTASGVTANHFSAYAALTNSR